jgi:hypothetical protein
MRYLFLLFFIFGICFANDFKRNNGSKVVIDTTNELMWVDDISSVKLRLNHKDATEYCENLQFAGYTNWRIPEIEELQTIVDKKNEKNYINRAFRYSLPEGYWARRAHWRTFWFYADYMYFVSGTPYYDSRHKKKLVRCVRFIQ